MALRYSDITVAQVVTAYEISGLNEFSIADHLDLLEQDVKAILLANSPIYQERLGVPALGSLAASEISQQPKSSPEYQRLRRMYETLAQTSDNDIVKEKCLQWLIAEELGRNDIPMEHLTLKKQMAQKSSTQEERLKKFNAMIERAGSGSHKTLSAPQHVIEVDPIK